MDAEGKGNARDKPGFTNHLVTTGLESLYEGITIASVQGPIKQFKPLIRSSDGQVVTACRDCNNLRIMFDGGFTRLYPDRWDRTAGTARFVTNAACWLYNHEGRQAQGQDRGRGGTKGAEGGSSASGFDGTCNKCGKHGHKAADCRSGGSSSSGAGGSKGGGRTPVIKGGIGGGRGGGGQTGGGNTRRKFCKQCGTLIDADSAFCTNCGAKQ